MQLGRSVVHHEVFLLEDVLRVSGEQSGELGGG
jgi:hypothetical protein